MISILMTSYNREKFISESIESILNQDYTDYEFIIVDDASTDNTWEIILDYAKKDQRIKPFKNECNLGDYQNRNKAASYAKGKYIKYVDSDDLIFVDTLGKLVRQMDDNPSAAFGLSADRAWVERNNNNLLSPKDLFKIFIFEGKLLGSSPTGSIIRRDIFESIGGFSGKQYVGDLELWLKLASLYNAIVFEKSLYYWREHEDQQMYFEQKNRLIRYERFDLLRSFIQKFEHFDNCFIKRMAIRNIKNIVSRKLLFDLFTFKLGFLIQDIKGYNLTIQDFLFALYPNRYPSNI